MQFTYQSAVMKVPAEGSVCAIHLLKLITMVRFLFCCIMAMFASPVLWGQQVQLESLAVQPKETRVVYIGIFNKFRVSSIQNIEKFEHGELNPLLRGDTLILRPSREGPLRLAVLTKSGKEEISFDARVLPMPMPVITSQPGIVVDKSGVLKLGKVAMGCNEEDALFLVPNYKVQGFQLTFRGRKFSIQGDQFPTEALQAFSAAACGDKLVLENVSFLDSDGKPHQVQEKTVYYLK